MKARNDGTLYTGMTDNVSRVQQRRIERAQAKEQVRRVLEPSAELFSKLIQKERDLIPTKVMSLISAETTEENSKSLILAYRLYDSYLMTLNMQIQNTMRVKESSDE